MAADNDRGEVAKSWSSRKRQGLWPSGLANNLPSKLARRGQVHNLRANNNWTESILREWMCYLWVCAAGGRRGTSWSSARTPWILPSRNGAASSPSEATRSSWATSSLQHEHFHFLFFESELICGARSTWCQVDQNYIFFKSFRLMAGIFISFVYLRIIPQYSRPKIRIFGLKLLRMSCVGTFFLFLISFRAGHFALLMGCLVPTSPHFFAIFERVVPLLEQNWQL